MVFVIKLKMLNANKYYLKQQQHYYYLVFSWSCGIDLGDYFVVTGGGEPATDTVTRYSQTGFDKDMAKLNQARRLHACSKFVDESGKTVCY